MSEPKGIQPAPDRGHPMPRRTTPERSVTLHHHRLAREARASRGATLKASARDSKKSVLLKSPARRKTSDESFGTGNSDSKKWFEQSNQYPTAAFDAGSMDVDPPFFQKQSDSSNEEHRASDVPVRGVTYGYVAGGLTAQRLGFPVTQSSSADDYRSVIDDLTVENKRLKEELKRYKQFGASTTRKDKLFEIKVHGLGKRKKRELESTLRDFAASLEGPSETTSQSRKPGKYVKNLFPSGESMSQSKHASSSSSLSRPVDSAYASMSGGGSRSRGPVSTGPFDNMSLPQGTSQGEEKLEAHIRDTPDGLYPRHVAMTDREKKKIVVRRLEQLFTGKIGGRSMQRPVSDRIMTESTATDSVVVPPLTATDDPQAMREAQFQPPGLKQPETRQRKNASPSDLSGEPAETDRTGAETGDSSGTGSDGRPVNPSPETESPPEQRPTRPGELDPDRVQIPADNLDYIRHLGMVPPEFVISKSARVQNVSPDAEGWVYLNLLGNLAQLHMFSVTPAFIRKAVTEMSAKFQLSPDGRKIRWRGGTHGTRFSSDSSAGNSQKSPSTDDTDGSNEERLRKKQKTSLGVEGDVIPKTSPGSGITSKFGPAATVLSDTFHYKPRFVHNVSSMETSLEGSGSQPSSLVEVENSNPDNGLGSRWGHSGSCSSPQKRRRTDGAIIYFGGAPFCIDLSGDPSDTTPLGHFAELATAKNNRDAGLQTSTSSSMLSCHPIDEEGEPESDTPDSESIVSCEAASEDDDPMEELPMDFPGCNSDEIPPHAPMTPFSPSGLGGVYADDNFRLVVKTCRPVVSGEGLFAPEVSRHAISADAIVGQLASMSTSSPVPPNMPQTVEKPVRIQYLSQKMEKLEPPPLPPPAMFVPPFSSDSDDESDAEGEMEEQGDSEDTSSAELISQRANPHQSVNEDALGSDGNLTSNDEEDEDDVDDDLDAAGWARPRGRL